MIGVRWRQSRQAPIGRPQYLESMAVVTAKRATSTANIGKALDGHQLSLDDYELISLSSA